MTEDRSNERIARLEARQDASDRDIASLKREMRRSTEATTKLTLAMEKQTSLLKGGAKVFYVIALVVGYLIDEIVRFVTRH